MSEYDNLGQNSPGGGGVRGGSGPQRPEEPYETLARFLYSHRNDTGHRAYAAGQEASESAIDDAPGGTSRRGARRSGLSMSAALRRSGYSATAEYREPESRSRTEKAIGFAANHRRFTLATAAAVGWLGWAAVTNHLPRYAQVDTTQASTSFGTPSVSAQARILTVNGTLRGEVDLSSNLRTYSRHGSHRANVWMTVTGAQLFENGQPVTPNVSEQANRLLSMSTGDIQDTEMVVCPPPGTVVTVRGSAGMADTGQGFLASGVVYHAATASWTVTADDCAGHGGLRFSPVPTPPRGKTSADGPAESHQTSPAESALGRPAPDDEFAARLDEVAADEIAAGDAAAPASGTISAF